MRQAAKDLDRVAGSLGGGAKAVSINIVKPSGVDLLEVGERCGHVVPEVVDDSFDGTAVNEMAVGVGELGLEDGANAPAGDGVGKGEGQDADDGGEEVAEQRPVNEIAQ